MVTIADMSSLEVDADVSEANITRVSANQNCEITLDAYPQRRYPGYRQQYRAHRGPGQGAAVMVKVRFKQYDQRRCCRRWARGLPFSAAGASADAHQRRSRY